MPGRRPRARRHASRTPRDDLQDPFHGATTPAPACRVAEFVAIEHGYEMAGCWVLALRDWGPIEGQDAAASVSMAAPPYPSSLSGAYARRCRCQRKHRSQPLPAQHMRKLRTQSLPTRCHRSFLTQTSSKPPARTPAATAAATGRPAPPPAPAPPLHFPRSPLAAPPAAKRPHHPQQRLTKERA